MTSYTSNELIAIADKVLLKSYAQQPIVMREGKGVELWDASGRRFLDMTAGISVCCLGHAHPRLASALTEQAARLLHVSNLYFIEQQILAAQAIVERCFADRVFFVNSGGEANEGALKLARRYQHLVAKQPERNTVVSTLGSFHGRTIATVSITGQDKYRAGFGPLFGPVEFVPYGDLDAAARILQTRQACAMILEPIQGEGGIVTPPPGYLAGLRELADETGTLLIFDEVQTGVARTGDWFAYQHDGVVPDVMTLAKGLGGGVPVGAVVASDKAAQGLSRIDGGAVPHASTFGGNPLACAAIVAVLQIIEEEGLVAHAAEVGRHLHDGLSALVAKYPGIAVESRGRGLLRGLALSRPAAPLMAKCRERGLLFSVAGGTVLRFAPALVVQKAHIDEALATLDDVLAEEAAP